MHVHKFYLLGFFFLMYLCLLYQVYKINIYTSISYELIERSYKQFLGLIGVLILI